MAGHTAVCLTVALLITCAQHLDAARVQQTLGTSTTATKDPFVCPASCQECCDQSFFTSSFKCILVGSYGPKNTPAKKKEYKQTMKDNLAKEGYACGTPKRRSKSLFQFKTSCSYKDNQEKPVGSCSKKTMCCCNEAQDAAQHKCIKPLEQQWFKWNRAFQHNSTLTVAAQTVVDAVAAEGSEASYYHIVMGEKEWRPNRGRGEHAQTYQQRTGVCSEGEGKWYVKSSGGFDAPVQTNEGCCLETEPHMFYVKETENSEMTTQMLPRCKEWKQLRHCDEDMMYMEFVGQRKGACLGDQSTGASLANAYGSTAAEWEGVATSGRASVSVDKSSCPAGWFQNGRGGVRSCDCDVGCGGVGAFLAFM